MVTYSVFLDEENISLRLAKVLVVDIAPEEIEFFDEIIISESKPTPNSDQFLGFGGNDTLEFVSNTLVVISSIIIPFLWNNGKDAAGLLVRNCSNYAAEELAKRFKLWIEKGSNEKSPILLGKTDIKELEANLLGGDAIKHLNSSQSKALFQSIDEKFGYGEN